MAIAGWLAGQKASDRIPLLNGLEEAAPSSDDLRALCATFGTTSAAPMLHIAGVTPESSLPAKPNPTMERIGPTDLRNAWQSFNSGPSEVQLIALGSPHFSLDEIRSFAEAIGGQNIHPNVEVIITMNRATRLAARSEGLLETLEKVGVKIVSDLCWCSISEPVFPPETKTLMTNSGKYAHYAPGLSGRQVRFGSLSACTMAATTGLADKGMPDWLA